MQFQALFLQGSCVPSIQLIDQIAEFDPVNPFCAPQFVAAQTQLGERPYLFALHDQNKIVTGCFGFLHGKSVRRRLRIVSLPHLSDRDSFWKGLWLFCLQSGVWDLRVESYGSPEAEIPSLPGETGRRERSEYILELNPETGPRRISSNHSRNISRAVNTGLAMRRTREPTALAEHVLLMGLSQERRARRGEQIEFDRDISQFRALLECCAGELFQAYEGEQIVSSALILRSRTGAYYQSAGTSQRGMVVGASPFLISRICETLRLDGVRVFNLGGASPENTGLRRFKAGFGAQEVHLEAGSFCPRPAIQRGFHRTLKLFREKQRNARQRLESLRSPHPIQ